MPRRIIFVNRVYWPATEATGQLLSDLAQALADSGFTVEVVTASAGSATQQTPDGNEVSVKRVGGRQGLTIGFKAKLGSHLGFLRASRKYLKSMIKGGDLVVSMTDPPLLGLMLTKLINERSAQHWHWSQDVYPEVAIAILPNPFLRAMLSLLRPFRNRAWRKADGIVAIGPDMAKLIEAEIGSQPPIKTIPNWAPYFKFGNPDRNLRTEYGYSGSDCLVVYSGNLGRAHILDPIIDLATQFTGHPNLQILVVGNGAQKQRLQQQVSSQGLENVTFRPPVEREDLQSLLSAADIHLVTMRPECQGTVLPSKFYGIIGANRPLIFIGPKQNEFAQEISKNKLGVACDPHDLTPVIQFLEQSLSNPNILKNTRDDVERFARTLKGLNGAIEAWSDIAGSNNIKTT